MWSLLVLLLSFDDVSFLSFSSVNNSNNCFVVFPVNSLSSNREEKDIERTTLKWRERKHINVCIRLLSGERVCLVSLSVFIHGHTQSLYTSILINWFRTTATTTTSIIQREEDRKSVVSLNLLLTKSVEIRGMEGMGLLSVVGIGEEG